MYKNEEPFPKVVQHKRGRFIISLSVGDIYTFGGNTLNFCRYDRMPEVTRSTGILLFLYAYLELFIYVITLQQLLLRRFLNLCAGRNPHLNNQRYITYNPIDGAKGYTT